MVEKVGRNDPCPCGSGKKYKNCHMLQEKETASAKYTPSGKRKFKAKVISAGDQSLSVFNRSAPTQQQIPASASSLEKLKFRKTNKDYQKTTEQEPLPFHIPTPEEPAETPKERERHLPQPDEAFKATTKDFQKKKE
ncbi:SEC-C metal-binding domain-containing protein [Chlamydiota bacterium]